MLIQGVQLQPMQSWTVHPGIWIWAVPLQLPPLSLQHDLLKTRPVTQCPPAVLLLRLLAGSSSTMKSSSSLMD